MSEENRKQQEDYDANVLNPEIKEDDLSPKEKRRIEKEKLKNMGWKGKLEYIWMYYKAPIFGVIAAIILVFVAVDMYQNAQVKTVLSIGIVNCTLSDTSELEEKTEEELGCEGDKYSQVEIGVNLTTEASQTEFEYYAQMAYVTQIQAGTLDVIVLPEKLYQALNKDEIFADIQELMGKDSFAEFGEQSDTTHLALTDSSINEELGVSYEPVCIVVPYNAPNKDNVITWMKSLIA